MELPIYYNLEEFKENYLLHFQEWQEDENFKRKDKKVNFVDYLEYYNDLIINTYNDIILEVENDDYSRLTDVSAHLIISAKSFKFYVEDNFKENMDVYKHFEEQDNYIYFKDRLQNDLLTLSNKDKFKIFTARVFYSYNVSEILEFMCSELIKLHAYNSLIPTIFTVKSIEKRENAPVIIAMLKELKIFSELTKRGFNKSAIIDSLYQIIGTNKKNIERYYDSMLKGDDNLFKEIHSKRAKDFLNSRGY